MKVHVDNYTRVMLTVIAVLLGFVALGLWFETPDVTSPAYARIPDQGLQLNLLIDEMAKVNDSVDELAVLLRSGDVKVRIMATPDVPAKTQPVVLTEK